MIQIKSDQIAYNYAPCTEQNMSIAVARKTSIDKWLFVQFVQFITAVRQIEASSSVAKDNINNFEVGKKYRPITLAHLFGNYLTI